MSNLLYFTSGIILGVYLDQKYDLPRVTDTIDKFKKYLETIEKNNK
jgi:hypothetical protein